MPRFVEEGQHFEAGDPLYIVEVMKMFNKVYAPFAGTIDKILVDSNGTIVSKGQPLFKVTPDDIVRRRGPSRSRKLRIEFQHRANTSKRSPNRGQAPPSKTLSSLFAVGTYAPTSKRRSIPDAYAPLRRKTA